MLNPVTLNEPWCLHDDLHGAIKRLLRLCCSKRHGCELTLAKLSVSADLFPQITESLDYRDAVRERLQEHLRKVLHASTLRGEGMLAHVQLRMAGSSRTLGLYTQWRRRADKSWQPEVYRELHV